MTLSGLLARTVAALERAKIPNMLTGSAAAAYYGAARATMDIDLVVDPTAQQLTVLVADLASPTVYVSLDAALDALAQQSMFNIVDASTGWKADLIIRKRRAFSETEFARRVIGDLDGTRVSVATLEDIIVAKLEWAKLSGSQRQLDDVTTLLRLHAATVDDAYIAKWVAALSLSKEWREVSLRSE